LYLFSNIESSCFCLALGQHSFSSQRCTCASILSHVLFTILQQLADIDHYKSLMVDWMQSEFSSMTTNVFGILATAQALSHTKFEYICIRNFNQLVSAVFFLVCFRYDYPQWIYPCTARLSIKWKKQRSSDHIFYSLAQAMS